MRQYFFHKVKYENYKLEEERYTINSMKKLSVGQLTRISEITGNIAVVWFSAGIIAPLFTQPKNLFYFIYTLFISLVMAIMFFLLSLNLMKEVRK
jgi:hypothetical protein